VPAIGGIHYGKGGVEMRCDECKYWVPDPGKNEGECRKGPPTPLFVILPPLIVGSPPQQGVAYYFSRIRKDLFCWEFKETVLSDLT